MKTQRLSLGVGVVATALFAAVQAFGETVEVTWLANSDGNLDHYRVHWGPTSRGGTDEPSEFSYANAKTVSPSATPSTTISGIDVNQITYFAVSAVGTNGLDSLYSVEVPFPDPYAAAPSGLAVTIVSSSRLDLSWTDNSDNEDGFKVDRRQSGTDAWIRIVATGPNVTTHRDTGLPADTHFYYMVKAYNAYGNSEYTEVVGATTPALSPPAAPSALAATADAPGRIRLSWSDNSNDETGFKIDRRQSGATNWVRIATPAANTESYADSGLPVNTKFYYMVKAYNGDGNSAYTEIASDTTFDAPPAAPSHGVAQATDSDRICLSWTDNSDNEDGFRIDRRRSGTTEWIDLEPAAADAQSYVDTGLPAATRFYYRLTAYNSGGDSATTPQVAAVTPAASSWTYRKGLQEVSAPVSAWRGAGYDDSGWAPAPMPIGYGGSVALGTVLDDMPGNYSTIFLRKTFTVRDPALVTRITLDADYDDGFVMWINGQEVARMNVAGERGDAVTYDGLSAAGYGVPSTCAISLSGAAIPSLRAGTNVLAIQIFNCLLSGSSDLLLDPVFRVMEGSTVGVEADLDQDGMPDAWEAATFDNTSTANVVTDSDGDGQSDIAEYVAGTNAEDPDDVLCVQLGVSAGKLVATFPTTVASGPGYEGLVRHYALQRCSDTGAWDTVPGCEDIVATGSPATHVIANADGVQFYRARVWLAE